MCQNSVFCLFVCLVFGSASNFLPRWVEKKNYVRLFSATTTLTITVQVTKIILVYIMNDKRKTLKLLMHPPFTVNSRLANTPLLRPLFITDKIQIPSIEVWLKMTLATVNSCLADTPLLRTLPITDKISDPHLQSTLTLRTPRYFGQNSDPHL